jgi:hypothetical protein
MRSGSIDELGPTGVVSKDDVDGSELYGMYIMRWYCGTTKAPHSGQPSIAEQHGFNKFQSQSLASRSKPRIVRRF